MRRSFITLTLLLAAPCAWAQSTTDVINAELAKFDRAMGVIDKRMEKLQGSMGTSQQELEKLQNREAQLAKKLDHELEEFQQTVMALYRMHNTPTEALLIQDAAQVQLRRQGVLQQYRKSLIGTIDNSKNELEEFRRVLGGIQLQNQAYEQARSELENQRNALAELRRQQRQLLDLPESQRATLSESALKLSNKTDLQQYLSSRGGIDWQVPQVRDIAPTLPVIGTITLDYNEINPATKTHNQGVTITAGSGAEVIALHDGRVIYNGPFRDYGNLVILEHQGGNHSLYSGFNETVVRLGDYISAGMTLGTLPKTEKPEFYFEVRRNGSAVDPRPWLKKDINVAAGKQ